MIKTSLDLRQRINEKAYITRKDKIYFEFHLYFIQFFFFYPVISHFHFRSIPQHRLQIINDELERDVMIRAIYDVKGIDMGTGLVRYKAEVDFDGRELTRGYIDKQDLEVLLKVKTV